MSTRGTSAAAFLSPDERDQDRQRQEPHREPWGPSVRLPGNSPARGPIVNSRGRLRIHQRELLACAVRGAAVRISDGHRNRALIEHTPGARNRRRTDEVNYQVCENWLVDDVLLLMRYGALKSREFSVTTTGL
jgi:hypothetical protein